VTLIPGLGSQGHRKLYRSIRHPWLSINVPYSRPNHRPISHRFRDKRRYPSKIARKSPIFPPPCI